MSSPKIAILSILNLVRKPTPFFQLRNMFLVYYSFPYYTSDELRHDLGELIEDGFVDCVTFLFGYTEFKLSGKGSNLINHVKD